MQPRPTRKGKHHAGQDTHRGRLAPVHRHQLPAIIPPTALTDPDLRLISALIAAGGEHAGGFVRLYGSPRRGRSVPRPAEDGIAMLTLLRVPF
jgi:hypothetical protein